MYREEKIIDGVLCWRDDPKGKWKPYTAQELTTKIGNLEAMIRAARRALQD